MLRPAVAIAVVLAFTAFAVPASAQAQRFTGKTSQGAAITLTVSGAQVKYAFAFAATCEGKSLRIPIEGSVKLTPGGAFLDDGTFASGTSSFRIEGNAPAGGERTGSIELTSPDCEPLEATWRAQRAATTPPGLLGSRSCPDPKPTSRLALDRLSTTLTSCAAARTAATRWARDCYQDQWQTGGTETCRVTSGGRTYTARMRATGPPGSGGLSRITLTSDRVRVAFDARVRGA